MVHVGTATCPTSNNILHFSHPFFTFITLFSLKITHLCSFLHYYLFLLSHFSSSSLLKHTLPESHKKYLNSLSLYLLLFFFSFQFSIFNFILHSSKSKSLLTFWIQKSNKTRKLCYSYIVLKQTEWVKRFEQTKNV